MWKGHHRGRSKLDVDDRRCLAARFKQDERAPSKPIDHLSLTKYPENPSMLDGVDGVPNRVPMKRERDEVVPVPVNDLVEAQRYPSCFEP